jgi:hypothetical protein
VIVLKKCPEAIPLRFHKIPAIYIPNILHSSTRSIDLVLPFGFALACGPKPGLCDATEVDSCKPLFHQHSALECASGCSRKSLATSAAF